MSYLLDTHVFLWLLGQPDRVAAEIRAELARPANELFVSAVSALEVATKVRIGKLDAESLVSTWRSRVADIRGETLDLSTEHAVLAGSLAWPHRDPFDRMLVAQALVDNLTLVSNDSAMLGVVGLRLRTW